MTQNTEYLRVCIDIEAGNFTPILSNSIRYYRIGDRK